MKMVFSDNQYEIGDVLVNISTSAVEVEGTVVSIGSIRHPEGPMGPTYIECFDVFLDTGRVINEDTRQGKPHLHRLARPLEDMSKWEEHFLWRGHLLDEWKMMRKCCAVA